MENKSCIGRGRYIEEMDGGLRRGGDTYRSQRSKRRNKFGDIGIWLSSSACSEKPVYNEYRNVQGVNRLKLEVHHVSSSSLSTAKDHL